MEKKKLEEIFKNYKSLNIGIVGDIMLDDYIYGDVHRISPEAPVPVIEVKNEQFVLGGGANVANNISSLGATPYLISVIGNDSNGKRLISKLEENNIRTKSIVISDNRKTTVKKRVVSHNQQLIRLDWEDKYSIESHEENLVLKTLKRKINILDAIIVSDYAKGMLTKPLIKGIIKLCKENNKIIIVDSKPNNMRYYKGVTSITPNKKEAIETLNLTQKENINYDKVGEQLKKELELEYLLLTKSEEGMTLFDKNKLYHIPTYAKEVYDPTGCGDTVISLYTLSIAAGKSHFEGAKIANAGAGVAIGKFGTTSITIKDILDFYNKIYKEW